MVERHFAFEAFRISIGKEGEKSSGEVCGKNSNLQWEASIHFGGFIW